MMNDYQMLRRTEALRKSRPVTAVTEYLEPVSAMENEHQRDYGMINGGLYASAQGERICERSSEMADRKNSRLARTKLDAGDGDSKWLLRECKRKSRRLDESR